MGFHRKEWERKKKFRRKPERLVRRNQEGRLIVPTIRVVPMDATRRRRTKDPARQRWYALHRAKRFAKLGVSRKSLNCTNHGIVCVTQGETLRQAGSQKVT